MLYKIVSCQTVVSEDVSEGLEWVGRVGGGGSLFLILEFSIQYHHHHSHICISHPDKMEVKAK